jgi:hypothetical protein
MHTIIVRLTLSLLIIVIPLSFPALSSAQVCRQTRTLITDAPIIEPIAVKTNDHRVDVNFDILNNGLYISSDRSSDHSFFATIRYTIDHNPSVTLHTHFFEDYTPFQFSFYHLSNGRHRITFEFTAGVDSTQFTSCFTIPSHKTISDFSAR